MNQPAGPQREILVLSGATAREIDQRCDQFEAGWRNGSRPRIEEALSEVDPSLRSSLLRELLSVEFEARRRADEVVQAAEYLTRFPNDSALIEAAFTARSDGLDPSAGDDRSRPQSFTPEDLVSLWSEMFGTPLSALQRLADFTSSDQEASPVPAESPFRPAVAVTAPLSFDLIEPVGQGGMGVVWKARQVKLNRIVALKMILEHGRVRSKDLVRFLAEAETLAAIQHPHVVQVYEFGEAGGRPYLAMEYLRGGSLADRLDGGKRLDPAAAAELVATLATAVQAAHDLGIVHRDLKPSNVLYNLAGQPKITDFGLAKWIGRADLTITHVVVGTPAYMAPEQARGEARFVGPGADVYSLGIILYECLTGTRPFTAIDPLVLLRQVAEREPEPLRRHDRKIARDVELICLKCLAKSPADRYPTAAALAADLNHFIAGEPVSVRPAGGVERSIRWARRQPTLAAAYALTATVAVLIAFGASVAVLWQAAERAKVAERQARGEAEAARDDLARVEYGRAMQVAYQEWIDNSPAVTRKLLDGTRAKLRGWEWDYVSRLCHTEQRELSGHNHVLTSVAYSPDGTRIASASWDRLVKVWHAGTGGELVTLKGHTDGVAAMAWSPDGQRIATAGRDATARIWDAGNGTEKLAIGGHRGRVEAVAWSPDGRQIATASSDNTARVWDACAGTEVLTIQGHTQSVTAIAWSPDGQRIATASRDATVRIWDAGDGTAILTFGGHLDQVSALAWSPDGKQIASTGKDTTTRIWYATTGSEAGALKGHRRNVTSVAWSPDGTRIATGSDDATAKVWDARTAVELKTFRGHLRVVTSVAWSADGLQLATASHDNRVRIWLVDGPGETLPIRGHTNIIHSVMWSRDGRRIATASDDGTARVWNVRTGDEILAIRGHKGPVYVTSWSPDGTRLATAGDDRTARVWDLAASGREVFAFKNHKGGVLSVAWSPDGRHIATASRDRSVKIWDASTGDEIRSLEGHSSAILSVAWSPDGQRIASGCRDGTARIWNAVTGDRLATLQGHTNIIHMVTWSPDGKRVATAARDGVARVWDSTDGSEIFQLKGHAGVLYSVSWSPDGARLATASDDVTARIWDARTGAQTLALKGHTNYLRSVQWSPDGTQLATASDDATAQIWGMRPDSVRD